MVDKIELKKINEYTWEIAKSGKMRVPAVIYASEKLIKDIEKDKTLQQIKNVATLPGIVGKAIALPDSHQGYGFNIGGVAAFDLDEGIISPGGVGYDINCLTGDSKILTEFGASIKIEDFEKLNSELEIEQDSLKIKKVLFNTNLSTLNLDNKKSENKSIELFMHKESEDVYEIELNSGLKIKATLDHPFLTKYGMKQLSFLTKNQELAVNLFSGIDSSEQINEKLAITTKILGYMFGDGCCYISGGRYYGVAYGSKEDLENMQKDLSRLSITAKLYSRNRDHKITTRYGLKEFNTTNYELHIYSQDFLKLLEELGMPQGNKTRQEVKLPEWIKKSNRLVKRLFLAGFFGAELSSPKTHSKTGFYAPIIDQNKIDSLSQNMRDFLIDISFILEEFGIKTTKLSEMEDFHNKQNEITRRFRLLISADEDNLLKLWRNIGFEYNLKRQKLANMASLYVLLKKQENAKRQEIAIKTKEYKQKGFKLKEVQKIFENEINARFVERHYYENVGQRINLNFISFNDFSKQKLIELQNFGTIFDFIKEIKKIEGKHKVYDFNIQDNHNFAANSFVVSNCGVRLLATNIKTSDFMKKRKEILHAIFRSVPSGVGKGGKALGKDEILAVLKEGAEWAVKKGYGLKEDLTHTEENGRMTDASPADVSQRAIARGIPQLGTLGSGNHFLEFQKIDTIFDKENAKKFGIKEDCICIMIHCGSRGLGHQVASDYIKLMEDEYGFKNLPDRELINAPIKSELGKKYLSAMNCAVNFAFANRQMIMHQVREQLKYYFPKSEIKLVYDVCHNIAKIEEHVVDGKKRKLCIHRKGATRAFDKQPVIIPGSMGTSSYLLVGTKKAEELTFGSTAHGAGRVESRTRARNELTSQKVRQELEDKDIIIEAGSMKGIVEEAPEVYKDIDEVVKVSNELGIGKVVAKLIPLAVMKG